jgi:hypothetical protein
MGLKQYPSAIVHRFLSQLGSSADLDWVQLLLVEHQLMG